MIGEIFDNAYNLVSLTAAPLTDVQTVSVPPGGGWPWTSRGPGHLHARRSRAARGLIGQLVVEGEAEAEIFMPHHAPDQMSAMEH